MDGKQLRNSILQWAIQGKLVPQDPNDEPASVLLERIREEKARLVKEKKIKRDKNESIIYRGDDNSYYEKILANGEVKCIDDDIPFDLPNTWCWVRLDNVITLLSGRDLEPSQYNNLEKGIPYMTGASNFLNEDLIVNRWTLFPATISHMGELLITCKGTIGTMAFNSIGDIHIARQIMSISSKYINLNYLKLYLEIYVSELEKAARSIIPGISRNDILTSVFPVPPLNEQARIVEFINGITPSISLFGKKQTELIKLNDKIKPTLKRSILQEAIQGRLVAQCETDEPASVLLDKIRAEKKRLVNEGKLKKSALEESVIFKGDDNKYWEKRGNENVCIDDELPYTIPNNWVWCRMQDVISFINGRAYKKEELLSSGKYKVLRVGNFFTNDTWYYSNLELPEDKYCYHGDLLYAWSASFGPQIWNGDKTIFHYHIWNVKYNTSILLRDYLYYFLLADKAVIKKSTTGSTMIHVSMENMKLRFIPIPPIKEQQRIVDAIVTAWQVL